MRTLPPLLVETLSRLLEGVPSAELRQASADLTNRYAHGEFIKTPLHRYAYLAARLPATYGVASHVFSQLNDAQKSQCYSFLDLGAGAGSLAWAACQAFPHVKEFTLIERDRELVRLGQELTALLPFAPTWQARNITEGAFPKHDVVVLSYVLNELSETQQVQVVKKAYQAAIQFLILIEPGTPEGFSRLLYLRESLLDLGAHMVAPCPQGKACPLVPAFEAKKDWCHFSVRIARESFHQHAKEGTLSYEDEKYMYLIVSPSQAPLPHARILKAPRLRTGHVILDLCTSEGTVARKVVSKKEGALYEKAKSAKWGGPWKD